METAKPPSRTVVEASKGCTAVQGAGGRKVSIPPAPGLRAQRLDRAHVRVDVIRSAGSKRCAANRVRLTLVVSGVPRPGRSALYRIGRSRKQTKVLTIPSSLGALDVVGASLVSAKGYESRSAKVLVSPP